MNRSIHANAARIAFENATHSYCWRFGGRRESPDPNVNVRGVISHADGSQEKGQEESRQEEDQEGEEEEVGR
jgi:hypothetical protein